MARFQDDQELVQLCLQNDPDAFRKLLDRYKNRVFSLIYRMVQNPSDAEDLAQESFLKAFKNLPSYDPSRPFLSWLFKITHNTTIDFLRARKPQALSIHDENNPIDLEDTRPTQEKVVEALSQGKRMESLLISLPPLYREVLLLRHQEELEYSEIAKILGIPVGTVKNRLYRARDLLKTKLEAPTKLKNETLDRVFRSPYRRG
jgi:RNA polymerase sigma-70 factor (ECF subfamily)